LVAAELHKHRFAVKFLNDCSNLATRKLLRRKVRQ